jgi:iron complex outermembrane receptor protein
MRGDVSTFPSVSIGAATLTAGMILPLLPPLKMPTLGLRNAVDRRTKGELQTMTKTSSSFAISRSLMLIGCATAAFASAPAAAQTAPEAESAAGTDIIVTAQRREETVQDVPFAITAVGGEQLATLGGNGFETFGNRVAGLQMQQNSPTDTQFFMRGVSTGSNTFDQLFQTSTVGIYFNEVPTDISALNPNFQLFDIERVEVLRGPQGTLYGSGSLTGAVRIIPSPANVDDLDVLGGVTYSNTHKGEGNTIIDGAVNVPVVPGVLAVRAVAYMADYGGYIDNVGVGIDDTNDVRIVGNRLAVRLQPSSSFTADLMYVRQVTTQYDSPAYDPSVGDLKYSTQERARSKDTDQLAEMVLNLDAGPVTLTSVTGYVRKKNFRTSDLSGVTELFGIPRGTLPTYFPTDQFSRTWTQEVRLASNGDGPFRWIVGGFYSKVYRTVFQAIDVAGIEDFGFPPGSLFGVQTDRLLLTDFTTRSRQLAFFADLSYDLTDSLTVNVGGRYFDAKQRALFDDRGLFIGGQFIEERRSGEDGFNPKVNVNYKITEDNSVYAQAARGFRLGGPNYLIPPGLCEADIEAIGYDEAPREFESDNVWSYEIGSKNKFADRRMTLNVAAYMLRWNNIQTTLRPSCGYYFQDNVGKAEVKGLEVETDFRFTPEFSVYASAAYTDGELKTAIPAIGVVPGAQTALTPKFAGSIGFDYVGDDGDGRGLFLSGDLQYVGKRQTSVTSLANFELDEYVMAGGRVGYRFGGITAFAFVTNIFDKRARLNQGDPFLNPDVLTSITVARPRTIGVTVRYDME